METPDHDHEAPWIARQAFQLLLFVLLGVQAVLWWAVHFQHYWLAVPFVLIASHLMHGQLIGLHEASHGLLRKSRRLNEFDGVLIGTISFVSFSLYRAAHQLHHIHLGGPRDEEFWPFVEPGTPRWLRVLTAFGELTFGMFVSPLIFMRTFLRKGSPIRSPKVRRRVWTEWMLSVIFWSVALTAVAYFGVWKYFLWMYFAPAFIAGNLQSWRRYIEHVGMTGTTVNGITRSIVAETWWGRLVALSLLHEPFHGVHHKRAGIPHAKLPQFAFWLQPKEPGDYPPFPSYGHAFVHLLRSLGNPRIGAQWAAVESASDARR